MFEKELSISMDVARFLAESGVLVDEFCGEVMFDPDVTTEGEPIVIIGADREEYERLLEIVPDNVEVQGYSVGLTLWCLEPKGLN